MAPARLGRLLCCALLFATTPGCVCADEVKVAVAANFTAAMRAIASGFQHATGHTVVLSSGSTGQLYAQIVNGAPFAVFLAADQDRPRQLEEAGRAADRFTYAIGALVLWSADPNWMDSDGSVLRTDSFDRLAIANPRTAPYGAAAIQVLKRLGLDARLAPRLVRGTSIAQAYQFVATGNAALGFVARSQVAMNSTRGAYWAVPTELHAPLHQDAVLLARAARQPAARALFDYLRGPEARDLIARHGYTVPPPDAAPASASVPVPHPATDTDG